MHLIRFSRACNVFKPVLDSIKDLVETVALQVSEHGISFQTMDASHVCLVLGMMAPPLIEIEAKADPIMIGLHVPSALNALKANRIKTDDLRLRTDPSSDSLAMEWSDADETRVMSVGLKLLDIDNEQLDIPETECSCRLAMPFGEFRSIVNDLAAIGDTITVSFEAGLVRFSAQGEIGEASLVLREKDGIEISCKEATHGTFSARYLVSFAKSSLCDRAVLELSDNMPLCVNLYLTCNGFITDHSSFVRFYIAPVMDDDDE